jgi:hypothetical protein
MYRASYCNGYINQRDAQNLVNSLYFSLDGSTCFGLSLVHLQEQLYKLLEGHSGTCSHKSSGRSSQHERKKDKDGQWTQRHVPLCPSNSL